MKIDDLEEELQYLETTLRMLDVYKHSEHENVKLQLIKDMEDSINSLINCDIDELIKEDKRSCDSCDKLDKIYHILMN